MVMDYMTWQGMYGNGVLIGMAKFIMLIRQNQIQRDQVQALHVFYAAGHGYTTIRTTSVFLTAIAALPLRRVCVTTSDFVVFSSFPSDFSIYAFRLRRGRAELNHCRDRFGNLSLHTINIKQIHRILVNYERINTKDQR